MLLTVSGAFDGGAVLLRVSGAVEWCFCGWSDALLELVKFYFLCQLIFWIIFMFIREPKIDKLSEKRVQQTHT